MTSTIRPVCLFCKHFEESGKCKAFPQEIPDEIYNGQELHPTPLEDQENELAFELAPGMKKEYEEYLKLRTWLELDEEDDF